MTKLNSIDELPRPLSWKLQKSDLPEFFVAPSPDTWGGKNDSSFSVYVSAENEPKPPAR